MTPFIAYDRTADGAGFTSENDGDEIFGGFVAPLFDTGWQLGFLYVHFFNNYDGELVDTDPALIDTDGDGIPDAAAPGSTGARDVQAQSGLDLLSPYVQGAIGPLDIAVGLNYFTDNGVENNVTLAEGDIYTDSSTAEYVRIGSDLGMFELDAQYTGTQDGGFVEQGFDTYHSMINNNPLSYNSPTSVYSIGRGLGAEGYNENFYIGSVKVNVTERFYLRGALGFLDIEVPDTATAAGGSDTSTVYDLEAGYQINDVVRTWATLGMIEENDVGQLAGNSLLDELPNDGDFAADRVVAGSINLGIEF